MTEAAIRQQSDHEIRLLLAITQAIDHADNFEDALRAALKNICDETQWVYGEAWGPHRREEDMISSTVWYTSSENLHQLGHAAEQHSFGKHEGLAGQVWDSQEPFWIADVSRSSSPEFPRLQFASRLGLKAALGIPIVANRQTLAVLIFFMDEAKVKDTHLIEIITLVAAQLGNALKRKQTEVSLFRKNAFVQLLNKAIAAANQTERIEDAMKIVLEEVCSHFNWSLGHVYLILEESNEQKIVSTNIYRAHDCRDFREFEIMRDRELQPSEGLPGRVLQQRGPAWVEDVETDPAFERLEFARRFGFKSALAFPVFVGEKIVAVMEFFSGETIAPDEEMLDVMAHIGTQLGRVIEREEATTALRESEQRYRTLIDSSPNAILVEQADRIVYANPAGLQILGFDSVAEMRHLRLNDLFESEDGEPVRQLLELKKAGGKNPIVESRFVRKDGSSVPVDVMVTETSYHGKPALRAVVRDLTEVVQLRDSARRMEKLAWIGEFSARIAHEIRNPLGSIVLNLRYLFDDLELPEKLARKRDDVDRAVAHLQEIVNGILDFARQREPELKPSNLHAVINSSLNTVKNELQAKQIEVAKEYAESLPRVVVDGDQIIQVFVNLFLNAKDAMAAGGRLVIRTAKENHAVLVDVEDNGEGIKQAELEQIFTPFFTTKKRGIGLGLAVVHQILEQHQCRVSVESQVGAGTKFTIRFSNIELNT